MENSDAAAARLSRALELLVRRLRTSAASEPLSTAAANALGRLTEEGELGITPLARSEGVSQPAMTQLVDRLVGEGLLERRVPDEDRRSVLVRATAAGEEAIDARRSRRAARLAASLDTLDARDQAAIIAALPALERLATAVDRRAFEQSAST